MRIAAWTDNLALAYMLRSGRTSDSDCNVLLMHLRKLASRFDFQVACAFQHRVHRKAVQADSLSNVLFPQPSRAFINILHNRMGGYPPEFILLSCNFLTPEAIGRSSSHNSTSVVVLPLGLGSRLMNRVAEYGSFLTDRK